MEFVEVSAETIKPILKSTLIEYASLNVIGREDVCRFRNKL